MKPLSICTTCQGLSLFVAALLCTTAVRAQDEPAPSTNRFEYGFGVKGGANWSNLWVEDVSDQNARFGFHVGLFARFAAPEALGFQLEALYDQKGTTVKKTFDDVDQTLTYQFDYITVPALVIIPLGEVFELHAGAYAAAMVISEVKQEGDQANFTNDPADSKFKGFDYGLVGGAAINIGMGQIGVRYEHGLNEVANNDISHYVLGSSKNSTLQAYLALALGKR